MIPSPSDTLPLAFRIVRIVAGLGLSLLGRRGENEAFPLQLSLGNIL